MGIVLAGEKYNWEVDHPVECVLVKSLVNLERQTKLTDGIWLSRWTITAALEEESASLLSSPGAMIIVPETSKIAESNKASNALYTDIGTARSSAALVRKEAWAAATIRNYVTQKVADLKAPIKAWVSPFLLVVDRESARVCSLGVADNLSRYTGPEFATAASCIHVHHIQLSSTI